MSIDKFLAELIQIINPHFHEYKSVRIKFMQLFTIIHGQLLNNNY